MQHDLTAIKTHLWHLSTVEKQQQQAASSTSSRPRAVFVRTAWHAKRNLNYFCAHNAYSEQSESSVRLVWIACEPRELYVRSIVNSHNWRKQKRTAIKQRYWCSLSLRVACSVALAQHSRALLNVSQAKIEYTHNGEPSVHNKRGRINNGLRLRQHTARVITFIGLTIQ